MTTSKEFTHLVSNALFFLQVFFFASHFLFTVHRRFFTFGLTFWLEGSIHLLTLGGKCTKPCCLYGTLHVCCSGTEKGFLFFFYEH